MSPFQLYRFLPVELEWAPCETCRMLLTGSNSKVLAVRFLELKILGFLIVLP